MRMNKLVARRITPALGHLAFLGRSGCGLERSRLRPEIDSFTMRHGGHYRQPVQRAQVRAAFDEQEEAGRPGESISTVLTLAWSYATIFACPSVTKGVTWPAWAP
jgi:hypothetical protein